MEWNGTIKGICSVWKDEETDYTAGTKPLIVNLGLWRIKFLICYDLRFPCLEQEPAKL